MKTTSLNRAVQAIAACAVLGWASASFAATTTWNLETGCGSGSTGAVACGTSGGNTLTAQAYSTATGTTSSPTTGTTFAAATMQNHGVNYGIGVQSVNDGTGSPNHAMDNNAGTDLIVLKFTSAVNLANITLGWWSSDYDISVLAYTGTGTPTVTGKTAATLVSSGWTSVKNYGSSGTATGTNLVDINGNGGTTTNVSLNTTDTTTYSSWWIISAYNSGYGGGAMDSIADYVKIMSVASNPQPGSGKVPEPGSLALIGLGLLGLIGTSRRKAKGQSVNLAA
nr:exosortase-dependent surface protein XDP1 [uncultured Albidiferax sp.]